MTVAKYNDRYIGPCSAMSGSAGMTRTYSTALQLAGAGQGVENRYRDDWQYISSPADPDNA